MVGDIEVAVDAQAALGEGAIWHARRNVLYWVDIDAGEVHVYDPATGADRAIGVGQKVGTVVPRASGGVMVAVEEGFAHLDLDTGDLTLVCDPPEHNPALRFNDGKCDPAGRFWAGTITGRDNAGAAGLYCLFADRTTRRMLTGVTNSNGICWSLDATTMYYIDTATAQVSAFDYDAATGEIGNRRTVITVPGSIGHPDGMTIDAQGMLWIAHWGGWSVNRWDPVSGQHLESIPVPADHVSSCAFGGPELDTLYVTTARGGLGDEQLAEQPHAGGLFRVRMDVRGVPAFEFAG